MINSLVISDSMNYLFISIILACLRPLDHEDSLLRDVAKKFINFQDLGKLANILRKRCSVNITNSEEGYMIYLFIYLFIEFNSIYNRLGLFHA